MKLKVLGWQKVRGRLTRSSSAKRRQLRSGPADRLQQEGREKPQKKREPKERLQQLPPVVVPPWRTSAPDLQSAEG